MSCSCGPKERYELEIIDIIKHDEFTYSYDFKGDLESWHEGDASKLILDVDGKEEARRFSYVTLEDEDLIRFTTRIKSSPSSYKSKLHEHKIGDVLKVSSPKEGLRLKRENRPVALISNGVGIAAIRAYIKKYEKDSLGIPEMLQINVDRHGKIFQEEMNDFEKRLSFRSIYLDDRKTFYSRLDFEMQTLMEKHQVEPYIYVIGSDAFVIETRSHLKTLGFSNEDILIEKHVLSSESCGCGPDNGCGCGANIIKTIGGIN
ncbi:hypothetical protein EZV73_11035 [Acidaminobacter sp. JC074]|uniref:hypothetical protein n=1 Tax=Acidaminobacter sp. JC074 TaxID=2530199 RepID=UPI001F0FEC62|nr:hypothetical protein [Acidaminobacter sp. JC074]MCH4888110.1 hypothetical protein [Acidaminobacter sp. JC074]